MLSKQKHVLIIDDCADMQCLLKMVLESKGYRTESSSNGNKALKSLTSGNPLPDVILLDLRMPVMNGYEFLIQQRQNSQLKNIPTIVMSGDNDCELTRSQTNPKNVLQKPLSMALVVAAVARNTHLN